tara:strand:- start:3264 stop:4472 length:1209 start_codon:yes stop_codon:yes gene_type:complete
MKSFNAFTLSESKNLHMEHLEDSIFNEGSKGAVNALKFAESVADMLAGNAASSFNVTVKWDGAPAVFCGINPENGKFFVGTKSVFNKTPKINYTNADIDANHGHSKGLSDTLKIALANLKDLNIKGVLQGDVMFTKGKLSTQKIDGESHVTFTPNTITYAIPSKSDAGKEVSKANIGIVFHTAYTGTTMDSMSASFGPDVSGLGKSSKVWYQDAMFRDASGTATFTKKESGDLDGMISDAGRKVGRIKRFLDTLVADSKLVASIKVYTNRNVRAGTMNNTYQGLIDYIVGERDKDIASVKTDATKKRKENEKKQVMRFLEKNKTNVTLAFELYSLLNEIKLFILQKLQTVKEIGTFIKKGDGFDATAPEGFVAVDHISNTALKLVDRLEFSRANFTAAKNWE